MVRSSPSAALGAVLAVLAMGTLAARHRAVHGAVTPTPPPAQVQVQGPVDLNGATAEDLERLPRIGPAIARRIIEDRTQRGPYRSVSELGRVRGVGPRTLALLAGKVVVGDLPSSSVDERDRVAPDETRR